MQSQSLIASFPPSIPVPPPLRKFFHWFDQHGYPISGLFELREHSDKKLCAGSPNENFVGHLALFGANADGSLICIWRQPDGRTPFVHLDSENVNNIVLAANAVEFLQLLAIGYDELGHCDLSSPADGNRINPAFKSWVRHTFKVKIPHTGAEITDPAQAGHDDFQKWIETKLG